MRPIEHIHEVASLRRVVHVGGVGKVALARLVRGRDHTLAAAGLRWINQQFRQMAGDQLDSDLQVKLHWG